MLRLAALVLVLFALAAPTASAFKAKPVRNPDVTAAGIIATVNGADLIVAYQISSLEIVNGQQFNTAFAPRLSVFQQGPKDWQIVAHANFNAPETK